MRATTSVCKITGQSLPLHCARRKGGGGDGNAIGSQKSKSCLRWWVRLGDVISYFLYFLRSRIKHGSCWIISEHLKRYSYRYSASEKVMTRGNSKTGETSKGS